MLAPGHLACEQCARTRQFALKPQQSIGNAQHLRSNHTYRDLALHCRSFLAADLSLGTLLPSDQSILDSSTKGILRRREQALLSPKLQTFIWLVGVPGKVRTPSHGSSQALLPSPALGLSILFTVMLSLPSNNFHILFLLLSSRNSLIVGPSGLSFCLLF